MSGATCPTCGKAIDPLRAPVVRIVGGKILGYCSTECSDRRPAAQAAAAATAAASVVVTEVMTAAAAAQAAPAVDPSADPARPSKPRGKGARATEAAEAARRAKAETAAAASVAAAALDGARTPAATRAPAPADDARPVAPTPGPGAARQADPAAVRARATGDSARLTDLAAAPPDARPAPDVRDPDDFPFARPRRSRTGRILALVAAVVAAGAALVILAPYVSPTRPSPVDAKPAPPPVPPPPAPPPRPLGAELYARARTILTAEIGANSDRVKRVAAMALARTGDTAAITALAQALDLETSAIARVEVAYALARAGDARGRAALIAGLASPRRDVRADAARALLVLGDRAGAPFMTELMGLEQNRLGAAEILARVGDAKAIAILRATLADPKTSRENHMRAAVALGLAGQADIAGELRAQLADSSWSIGAAQALAAVGDPAAGPVLTTQLEIPSLRVAAAIGLRRLERKLTSPTDPAAWIDRIGRGLEADKDTDQVSAAEAALILFGAPALAEHD